MALQDFLLYFYGINDDVKDEQIIYGGIFCKEYKHLP